MFFDWIIWEYFLWLYLPFQIFLIKVEIHSKWSGNKTIAAFHWHKLYLKFNEKTFNIILVYNKIENTKATGTCTYFSKHSQFHSAALKVFHLRNTANFPKEIWSWYLNVEELCVIQIWERLQIRVLWTFSTFRCVSF